MGDRASHAQPLNPLPRPHPKLAVRVVAGEALILTPQDSVLHTLNPTATRIWEMMPRFDSVDALARGIADEFEVAPETARADLDALLADLREKQILE